MKKSPVLKFFLWFFGTLIVLYLADAAYPQWDYSCSGHTYTNGLHSSPATIPELDNDERVVLPPKPAGCTVTPHNLGRKAFNYFFPVPERDSP